MITVTINKFKLISVVILFLCLAGTAIAQTDSTRISYSQESEDSSDYNYKRVYPYLDINMKNEKRLFKVAPDFQFSGGMQSVSLQLLDEFKIKNQWSLQIKSSNTIEKQKNHSTVDFSCMLGFDVRYYWLLNKQMKQGTSGNNLNGLYFGMGFNNFMSFGDNGSDSFLRNSINSNFSDVETPDLSLYLGLQKRLNNWSYLDVFSFVSSIDEKIYIGLDFQIGFAWGNKK